MNQQVRIGTSEVEVPQWWDHAALQHLPGGRDRWVILEDRWLVRIHGETRRRSFQPIHRSCPVRAEQIGLCCTRTRCLILRMPIVNAGMILGHQWIFCPKTIFEGLHHF